jgi:hypothetical protein
MVGHLLRRPGATKHHLIDPERPHDVLDLLLPDVREPDIETTVHLLAHRSRHADPAGLGQRFQPRRDIDAVARDVGAVDDDVTQVDADAELDALVGRLQLVIRAHRTLHVDRATQRGVGTAEFEQHPVTSGFDDPAAVFGNFRPATSQAGRADAAQAFAYQDFTPG